MLRTLLVSALLVATVPASAEIYRWVDAQGHVHYSDRPVPGATRVVGIVTHATNPAAVAERNDSAQQQRQAEQTAAQKEQTDRAAAKTVDKDVAKIQEERCKKAREDYRVATESQRLYRVNKDGERVYLSDQELTEARINARKALDEACGKQPG